MPSMRSHERGQRKQLRALAQQVSRKLADINQRVNMQAFGFSLALVSSLLVSGVSRFSTQGGRLDRAIKLAVERGAFTPWKNSLAFVDTMVGLRCVQLQETLLIAQMAGILWFVGPSFNEAEIVISVETARTMLRSNKLDEETARSWGAALVAALAEV